MHGAWLAAKGVKPPIIRARRDLPPGRKGWDFLLLEALPTLAGRSEVADAALERTRLRHDKQTEEPGIARPSPRAREREHRRCTQAGLEDCALAALDWLGAGGSGGRGPTLTEFHRSERWGPALRAASRTSPFCCEGDVRGRMRELLNGLLSDTLFEPLEFLAGPELKVGGYHQASTTSTNVPFVAQRLALPDRAALLPLRPWLSHDTLQEWEKHSGTWTSTPGGEPDKPQLETPKAYFAASAAEWRQAARRIVRSGLGVPIAPSSCPPGLAAGAFTVAKDPGEDRLIGDRRPLNALEAKPGPVRLPYAPRIRRLRLAKGKCLWAGKRDISNCFYMYDVGDDRLSRQVIGPRLPRSWFDNIDDAALDDVTSFEPWCVSDLFARGDSAGKHLDEEHYCQLAIRGVMMGDVGAVTVVQEAHSRLLLSKRVLEPTELVGGSPEFGLHPVAGDVFIDDLVILVAGEACRPPPELLARLARADAAYHEVGFEVKASKRIDGALRSTFWGASLRGDEGLIGFSPERRASLCAATLIAATSGVSGVELQRLLGLWVFAAGFRREALSVIGSSFTLARLMPPFRRTMLTGPVLDELLTLVGISPLLDSDLRTDALRDDDGQALLFATDADGEGGLGGCEAPVEEEVWARLYALGEEKGEYVRLDWADSQPSKSSLSDRRAAAASYALTSEWRVSFRLPAAACPERRRGRECPHINVLELRAVLSLIKKLAARGAHDCRVLVLIDSRVALGALGKGRSSSRQINRVLRQVAALALYTGIVVEVVWVPTWANPSDAPSRGFSLYVWRSNAPAPPALDLFRRTAAPADREMWRRLLGPAIAVPEWHPTYEKFYPDEDCAVDSGRGLVTPSGVMSVKTYDAPAASGRHSSQPGRGYHNPAVPMLGPPCCPPRSPPAGVFDCAPSPPAPAWTPEASSVPASARAPRGKVAEAGAAHTSRKRVRLTRSETEALQHWRRRAVRTLPRIFKKGGAFLEVFCGLGRLTTAFKKMKCRALDGIDLHYGPRKLDMTNDQSYMELKREILTKDIAYVHFGTPCTTFSSALRGRARKRSVACPMGPRGDPKIEAANLMVQRTAELCNLLARQGKQWSIENPSGSLIWRMPEFNDLTKRGFNVSFDACAYGGRIPGEGPFKKPTKVLTNAPKLRLLCRKCKCVGGHVELKGKTKVNGRWVNRTAYASSYTSKLAHSWARLMMDDLRPRLSKALADWKRLFLLMCGDIEPHPGPARRRQPSGPNFDVLVNDVSQMTASRYDAALKAFESWLALRDSTMEKIMLASGAPGLVGTGIAYLRSVGQDRHLSAYAANTFAAALRRYVLLASSLGFPCVDYRSIMRPMWRVVRSWNLAVPPEFRQPVPGVIALALAAWAWVSGHLRFMVTVLLSHHCLLRPEEAREMLFGDIVLFEEAESEEYNNTLGLVAVTKPKTRRNPAHAARQHVIIEDAALARLLQKLLAPVPAYAMRQKLWHRPARDFLDLWHQGLLAVGAPTANWLPAGLRGGGATENFLRNKDIQALRRRGRWTQMSTLERYLQEGVLLLTKRALIGTRVRTLAGLLPPMLENMSLPPPPLHLSTT